MDSSHQRATTSPIGWDASASPGVCTKELLAPADADGDAFGLIRLAVGARTSLSTTDRDRFLVLQGSPELRATPGAEPVRQHEGDYLAPPVLDGLTVHAPDAVVLLLRVTGPGLGEPATDVFGPQGWFYTGPGVWAKLLIPLPDTGSAFDERLIGLTWFAPGATADRHRHPTAHRFLFLDGEADDEIIGADGHQETARRHPGDFVDYPVGIEHSTHSPGGCLLLFVHEAHR